MELRRFLAAVDASLSGPARMILVGGCALAIGYEVGSGTRDIDTWQTDLGGLRAAIARARDVTGLDIPVGSAAAGDVPYDYESRLRRVMADLRHLEVYVLEKHDLALSKILRCDERDLMALEDLHRLQKLDEETLVARYMGEMDHAIGDPARIDLNLVVAVERLFGEIEADGVRRRVESWRRRSPR